MRRLKRKINNYKTFIEKMRVILIVKNTLL